jgi:hypothetical protein
VLTASVATCRVLVRECAPFISDGAARLRRQLGDGAEVGRVGTAFAQLGGRGRLTCVRGADAAAD